jgi:hypothetical protein
MKRLRRILLNALTVLSLLLALATAGLWVRSQSLRDYGNLSLHGSRRLWIDSSRGRFLLGFENLGEQIYAWRPPGWFISTSPVYKTAPRHWPIELEGGSTFTRLWLSHWVVVAVSLAFPTARLAYILKRRQMCRLGRCSACGYDMRANPTRCSECGHEPLESRGERLKPE